VTRQEQKLQTRHSIRENAKELFKTQGFAATTSRQIASKAGVALGTIFVHFSDKQAILEDILFEDIETVVKEAFATLPKHETALKQLLHLAEQLYRYYFKHLDLSRELLKNNFFNKEDDKQFREYSLGS